MNIRIFSSELVFLGEIDNFSSLTFQRRLYEAGQFILKTFFSPENYTLLKAGNLIMVGNDATKVGLIKEFTYQQEGNTEIITIKGYELKTILSQRITIPISPDSHQSFSGIETETIMKEIVQRNCKTYFNFPLLELATDLGRGATFDFNSRYKKVADELKNLGVQDGFGWKVYLDLAAGKYEFDIIEGTDRTSTSANPVIFADKWNNIRNQIYSKSDMNSYNYAIVGGQGEGALRTIVETGGSETGVDLIVNFVDARDINVTAELTARGDAKISENSSVESFECTIISDKPFEKDVDYFLGDYVTIQNEKLGLQLNKQITGINEYYQAQNEIVEVIFGAAVKGIISLINDKTDSGII